VRLPTAASFVRELGRFARYFLTGKHPSGLGETPRDGITATPRDGRPWVEK
jgi:hypothetical protein